MCIRDSGNSFEGFGELRDRSGIEVDENNVSQQEAIVREAFKEFNLSLIHIYLRSWCQSEIDNVVHPPRGVNTTDTTVLVPINMIKIANTKICLLYTSLEWHVVITHCSSNKTSRFSFSLTLGSNGSTSVLHNQMCIRDRVIPLCNTTISISYNTIQINIFSIFFIIETSINYEEYTKNIDLYRIIAYTNSLSLIHI